LAQCAWHRVSVSSSGIVPSYRYSEISFRQSVLRLGGLTIVAISPSGSWLSPVGSAKAPGLASEIRAGSSIPSGVPGIGARLSLPRGILGVGTVISSSSWMEGLNKSYVNTIRGGGSQLDSSWAKASAASLSR
jgi:hypothetical protein